MDSRDQILSEIQNEAASGKFDEVSHSPSSEGRARGRPRWLRVGLSAVALAAAGVVVTATPAHASCSNWMYPSHVQYTHSKTCNLGIREYRYIGWHTEGTMQMRFMCYDFRVRQFVCADWYDAGTDKSCVRML